jgi:hypothetical protein
MKMFAFHLSVKGISFRIFIMTVMFTVHSAAYSSPEDSSRIIKLIARLGDIDNSVNFKIMDTLKDYPDKYWLSGKLIDELDTTADPAYEDGKNALGHYKFDGLHIIWCWRALRMITSLDFFGKSRQTLEGVYEEYLLNKETAEIKYCHVWVLKSIVYMAPGDAQLDIINQWKDWYKKEAKNFTFKTLSYQSTLDF